MKSTKFCMFFFSFKKFFQNILKFSSAKYTKKRDLDGPDYLAEYLHCLEKILLVGNLFNKGQLR